MTYQRLKINRFVAIRNNRIMYDQLFHDGINVIRGEHSVGKSTLLDLIFYSLGGELKEKEWKSPLTQYEKVIIEVTIGTRTLTLSRQIETNNKKPYINVFEGNLDDALLNHNKWLPLGPSRSENKMSFSEFLFEALGWGQSITSEHNNLTMHQILRLLYLSQTSNSTNILRSEPHLDKESTRQAIGDFLLGLDDLSLYEIRQNIWKLRRSIEQKNSDIKSYRRLLNIDESTTIENIQENIKIIHDKLSLSILEKKDKLNEASPYMPNGFSEKIMNTSKNIAELTKDIKYLSEKEQYINSEITDCMLFSKSLQFRIKSLNESKNTFVVLGEMSFNYCPSCFSTISENENATTCKCSLCKSDLPKYSLEEKYTETLTELKYQQRQNQKTITSLNSNLLDTKEVLIIKQNELRNLEFILRDYSTSTNEREIIIEEYSKKLSLIEKKS
ncbi:hypothetical protein [Photobacterium phosphoreum]|uniref:hypothetical protein n=1 Tax=Photobacterium phosphoreum TaxID=659 RepID=UPI0005D3971D|nr:hypothetical protein [Photobacterium phosphoreum]KJF86994.1 hypothetical protein UB41_08900 [Photobacterium phosphoreum]